MIYSDDPMILELTEIILDEQTASPIGATKEVLSLVKYACESILSIPQRTLAMECKKISDEAVKTHWNGKLNT